MRQKLRREDVGAKFECESCGATFDDGITAGHHFQDHEDSRGRGDVGASNQVAKQGSFVVVDPTGRDLLDCCEVGVVLETRDGEDGPEYVVAINGTNQTVTCTVITAVLS
jgi:hypothetical protein